jgi:outer membrane immunogenic protein
MKSVWVASIALLSVGLVQGADAADMPVKAPPLVVVSNWTGWYVGVNAGGVSSDARFTASPNTPGSVALGAFTAAGAAATSLAMNQKASETGFTGGGQVGYNIQLQNWLVGFEFDIAYTGVSGTVGPVTSPTLGVVATESFQSRWLNTDRLRLGYVNGPWLVYATGGLALAEVRATTSTALPVGFGGGAAGTSVIGTTTDINGGWTAGGGVEWRIDPRWSVKAEYLHVDLGNMTVRAASTNQAATLAFISTTVRVREDIARIGLNFRL